MSVEAVFPTPVVILYRVSDSDIMDVDFDGDGWSNSQREEGGATAALAFILQTPLGRVRAVEEQRRLMHQHQLGWPAQAKESEQRRQSPSHRLIVTLSEAVSTHWHRLNFYCKSRGLRAC